MVCLLGIIQGCVSCLWLPSCNICKPLGSSFSVNCFKGQLSFSSLPFLASHKSSTVYSVWYWLQIEFPWTWMTVPDARFQADSRLRAVKAPSNFPKVSKKKMWGTNLGGNRQVTVLSLMVRWWVIGLIPLGFSFRFIPRWTFPSDWKRGPGLFSRVFTLAYSIHFAFSFCYRKQLDKSAHTVVYQKQHQTPNEKILSLFPC